MLQRRWIFIRHAVAVAKAGSRGVIVARASEARCADHCRAKTTQGAERRYKVLKEEHELLKKSHPVCFRSESGNLQFIEVNRMQHSHADCRSTTGNPGRLLTP